VFLVIPDGQILHTTWPVICYPAGDSPAVRGAGAGDDDGGVADLINVLLSAAVYTICREL
jgi:hypothetical protein